MCPPYTSHQPLAIFHTAPAPVHLLQAQLHCHIWMCLSIHGSHCLEEFSPQTSPSGISYPMVGVPSMCPPPPINLRQYSTLHLHPHTHSEPGCTPTLGRACPSNVSHCLEEFSPQTSPSGTIYPMVGVPSMCPPHPFSHFPTSGHPCGPAFLLTL